MVGVDVCRALSLVANNYLLLCPCLHLSATTRHRIPMDKHRHFSLLRTILRPKSSRIGSRSRTPIRLRRHAHNPADDPLFQSVLDKPVRIISTRKKHTFLGVVTLSLIPFTAFCLGTWQIQRLDWKVKLLAKFEDRLVRPPLPLPPRIDPSAISEFDYRRVYATGRFRHDKEMLLGPRMNDGTDGFFVITPLERDQGASTVLVNRGWISRVMKFQQDRSQEALPNGEVTVAGLLREPFKKNFFTPVNKPEDGKFYFPDVEQMSQVAGSQAVWIEETMGV